MTPRRGWQGLALVAAALSVAALQWWELEAEDGGHFPLALAVSPSIASRLAAVKKTTPKSVERKIDAMAALLAQEELYKAVSSSRGRGAHRSKSGFSAWMSILSNAAQRANVEDDVKSRLLDRSGGYGQDVWASVPEEDHAQVPALATQAAHRATTRAFNRMRLQLVSAGDWDKGYLPAGHSLVEDPLTFGNKYKGEQFKKQLGRACRSACAEHAACRGYTFNPSQGVCYLKTTKTPSGGFECTHKCWYWGEYAGHGPSSRLSLEAAKKDLGLSVTDVQIGSGQEIIRGGRARIGYIGTLSDGSVFDQGQYTFTFGEGQVITGDDIGLQGMRVGGKRKLVIPASLAYGKQGFPGSIPPESTLTFVVKLYSVSPRT